MQYMRLQSGIMMPSPGEGVFRLPDDESTSYAVQSAIEAGFRHIDTAAVYGNERATGEGIRRSGVRREDLFVTSKLWNDDIREGRTRDAFFGSLKRLGLDYLDLYLIHWPAEGFGKAWREMERLYSEGYVKAIGVSNFHIHHLEKLMETADVKPMVDQIESHPYLNNNRLIDYLSDNDIVPVLWSTLGGSRTDSIREDETLLEIGRKYMRTPSQIILRWDIERGTVPLMRSTNREHMRENLDIFDFSLSPDDIERINNLDRNMRVGSDPDNFNF